jgi:predicted Fe-Mo cluster-binding NifX family protein
MKIAVTAKGPAPEDQVDPRFGRCAWFQIVETETTEILEAVENTNAGLGGGAGIQSAQLMADHDVKAVLTGNCGPNAFQALSAAGIEVAVGASGRVRNAIEQYNAGNLQPAEEPSVASHFGMGSGTRGAGRGMGGVSQISP